MLMRIRFAFGIALLLLTQYLHAQQPVSGAQQAGSASSYPRAVGYMSFIHPLVTFNNSGATYNFSDSYTVGFPCGVNVLKSDRRGFSFEITPFIVAAGGTSRLANLLFDPGMMFRYPGGFTFIGRLAFETSGRYGVTPVFNKVIIRTNTSSYFIAFSLPVRFGNDKPASIGTAFQVGITF